MVKKVINVGVEGNDASGDPIREAFIKTNENFNEIYSFFGSGDGISITALEEGPDETVANSILIMNDANTQYLSKTLEGIGIDIINTNPTKITLRATSTRVSADPNPSLSNHLDAKSFNLVGVGSPDSLVANQLNVNIDTFAIPKGYADSRYVNVTGDTMTGMLNVPAGAKLTQVPQAQETVLRAGGLTSQMTGPLILQKKIEETDLPLTAATKEYVDVSSFISQVNLFVSTQGDDNQFDVPVSRKGRSEAYAFATLSAACRYAKRIMDDAPLNVSITVKDITYGNGAGFSVVDSINQAGNSYTLVITNDGAQTDPRDAFDIRPGQIIKGKVSKAIVQIQELGPVYSGTENFTVIYRTEQELIEGEPIEYGNPVKDTQITIFVESGNYYEHYPIRVPPNTSISGDELRRTLVRPRPGRSASWAINTYFRRDPIFDGTLSVADRTYGFHYLTDSSRSLYTTDLGNETSYNINASYILSQNREFIQEEVIGYVNTALRGLQYDEVKCRRDLGYIITALSYDMVFGSNFNSIAAARAYYRGTQAAAVLGSDKTATLESLDQLKLALNALVSGTVSQTRISNNIDLMKSIINTGLSAVPAIVWPLPSSIDTGYANARNLIYNNRSYLQAEIVAYIDNRLAANQNTPSSIWYNLEISGQSCARDVGVIVDAIVYDLTYGGNLQSVDAALAYYFNAIPIVGANEIAPTLEAYSVLKTIITAIVTGGSYSSNQTTIPRIGGTPGTTAAANAANALVEVIRFTLTNNGTPPASVAPALTSVETVLSDNFNLIVATTPGLKDDIIDYINNNFFIYNETLCKRDVGLLVDALVYDLYYGGFYKSLEAANSYFESASSLIAINEQLTETVAAIEHLGVIALRVLQKQLVTPSYQNAYPISSRIAQARSMTQVSEIDATTILSLLVEFMIKVISEDTSVNPTKDNDKLDVFLMNDATIIRNVSCQEHGGFMCVLDPFGQILTKSPYVQTSSSFSKSINEKIFAGGMFVDAFAGNVEAEIITRESDTAFRVAGLNVRLPFLPCAFYINGIRFQVDLISQYDEELGTALIHVNPNTPDDPEYTLIEDSTRLFLPSTKIEFLSAGNNSMLCNDYTQLNDLGYGLVAVNGGLLEAVSVFTYYNQISYFADTGGQIRSVGGSSAHGSFALVAKGAYPLEIPDDIYLLNDMVVGASVYSPFDIYTGLSGTNLSGSGTGAKFNVTVNTTTYVVTINTPGTGYSNGNQIVILGNEFGGLAGVNDLTITVTSVSGGGITGFTRTGTIPEGAPINQYYNRAQDIVIYINNLTTEYTLANSSELEVEFGTSPNKEIYRYLVNNAQEVLDFGDLPVLPTGKLYRVNLASGGLGAGTTGIKDAIADGTRVTIRQNISLRIYDINRETATRPSTALIMDEATSYVNRVIAISNLSAKVGTFTWDVSLVEVTSEAHGLSANEEIYLVFLAGTSGNPSRGYYTVDTIVNADKFRVTSLVPTTIYSEGSVTWGLANGECEAQLKEPFRTINFTTFYDSNDQSCQPFTTTVIRTFSSTNELSTLGTGNLQPNMAIKFTTTVGNIVAGTTYYVKTVVSDTKFTMSDTLGGAVKTLTDTTTVNYATSNIVGGNYYTWGVTGSKKIAVRNISTYDETRITYGVTTGFKMLIGWGGRIHQVTSYRSSEANGTAYAVLEIDNLTGSGLIKPVGLVEGGYQSSPNLKAVLPADSPGNVTIQISTVRCTGHDMLDVGTGSYTSTNFPNIIYGRPDRDPDAAAEVLEIGKGRVFYASTDQDGNFKVGEFFKVDQGTGTVTFSSSIAISNLDGLGFKRGVAIAEFSVDDSMFDNATDTVPTEQAVRSYIDRRLGLTHNGAIINPATGRLIPNVKSGFMSLDGLLAMKANMNMGSFKIVNLLDPTSGSDAANKAYVDTKLALTGGTMTGAIEMSSNKITGLGTPTNNSDAVTKLYVDNIASSRDELREMIGVSLPSPITGITNNSIFAFNGTSFTWGAQTGDVLFTLGTGGTANTFTSAIQPNKIVNSMINSSAGISQSKLELNISTATAAAPSGTTAAIQAANGLASFNTSNFTVNNGWVSVKGNGISLSNIQTLASNTVIGNSTGTAATATEVSFATIVQTGGALYLSQFTSNGVVARTASNTYTTVPYQSSYSETIPADKGTIVLRDASNGGFSASIINATTQFNVAGNKAFGFSGTSPNQNLEMYTPQGGLFLSSRTISSVVTTTVSGSWVLGTGATLEATYAADIAEYYQGDKVYEPGTVLMIGGEFDVTLANGQGTTKVAGVVSTEAAYIMNGSCPGEKNLVALQGRVPCKVIGKVEKGDLMVVGIVPGVAMASADPKPGSIIGKALQNYDSDHVGIIEVMVGKH